MCDDTGMSEGEYQIMSDELYGAPPVWVTKNGRELPIADMDDSHLINTIRFLRRNVERYQIAELSRMDRYVADAPEGAAMACEMEADRIMDLDGDDYLRHRFPIFAVLLSEAQQRKLSL